MSAQHKNSAFLRVKHDQLSPTNVIWAEVMCATLNPALNNNCVFTSSKLEDG